MKKGFWILSLALVFFSCSSNKKAISDFKQILGAKNSADLTKLVDYFEKQVLDKNFDSNSLSNKYTYLIQDCSEKGAIELLKNQELDFYKFKKTQMWNEVFSQVDSTWINEDGSLSVRLIYNSENGVLNNGMRGLPEKYVNNPDSLMIEALDWEYLNHRGAYMKALEQVKNRNSFINEYYSKKTTVGDMDSRLFCDMILRDNPDFSDYFVKRIFIIELIYKYVS
ncbi:hypothetical protein R3X28_00005 [Maribacter sp. TH_r10]|uniref:hypothetical protein n=1 Tax=Maribacter sp. TH_r10 TaxID=3082086 RepID=UPI002953E3F9|nr:hypothetical protein [Maribacter sp. TH_r10]MDV7137232.1 hypothetical protein [Maribacter sp. TH_r10]